MVALGWQAGLVIGVVTVGLILMMGDWVAPHLVFSGMVGVLMAARVITEREGAAGFSSTGVLTVRTTPQREHRVLLLQRACTVVYSCTRSWCQSM
jgi:hypothetical protein